MRGPGYTATGPFGDATLQPALSDYSDAAGNTAPMTEAEAESNAPPAPSGPLPPRHGHGAAPQGPQQPGLLSAYSEPLPFSAPLPHHLALHQACPSGLGGRQQPPHEPADASSPATAQPAAPPHPPASGHPPGYGPHAGYGPGPYASYPYPGASGAVPPQQHPPPAPHRLARSMPTLEPVDSLPPAHSAPAPGSYPVGPRPPVQGQSQAPPHRAQSVQQQGVSSPAQSPMQLDGPSASALGARAMSGGVSMSAGGAETSPSDARGKRVRQQGAAGMAGAAAAPMEAAGSASAGTGAAAARATSPSGRGHSAGDPMSVGGTEGAPPPMYNHGAAPYPYPYAPPPAYGMGPPPAYGMRPYGDPYYGYYGYPPYDPHGPPPDSLTASYPPPHHHDPSAPRVMHYPGFMAPRHRLYRRFVSAHGRRDGAGPGPEGAGPAPVPMPSGPPRPGPDGLSSMGSAPLGAPHFNRASSNQATTAPTGSVLGGPSAGGAPTASDPGPLPPGGLSSTSEPGLPPGGPSWLAPEQDMDSAKAARECHDAFAADDVPLPLSRATVDGIRQELREVTQELMHKRMGRQGPGGPAPPGSSAPLQPPSAAPPHPLQPLPGMSPYPDPMLSAPSALPSSSSLPPPLPSAGSTALPKRSQPAGPLDGPPLLQSVPSGSLPFGSGPLTSMPSGSLPAKRPSAPSGGGASISPGRPRPAPSAPAGMVGPSSHTLAPGLRASSSTAMSIDAVTAPPRPRAPPSTGGAGPQAMRQLFPPSGGGAPPGLAVPVGAMGPGPAASAPAGGPRPAMSGRSVASASASVPHQGAAGAAPQPYSEPLPMPQHGASAAAPAGIQRQGPHGSIAGEAEDDERGEEVHGPPQRSSNTRISGVVPGPGMPPPAARHDYPPGGYSYAYGHPPPGSYPPPGPPGSEYPPSYYYPPPPHGYGAYGQPGYPYPPPVYRGQGQGAPPGQGMPYPYPPQW
ncbi:hypothetical protein HYH03_004236 [Edaphochlamys debaryana]|uniref:Uncharacterized protein n=1 Tax=Edaphochlamys debaryana TaxID=47281 RepID=A0A835YAL9_9CHLO|nr:hypothetical protein HYH03_004236 [Edaphochlamys debaryana]|eukprot:KAG2497977.1 hypothetical protein HYH03_004236 [Edaphochlamys debaryana]